MSIALYRKYRPQTFQDVSGQIHIKTTLQNELELGKVSHAYLLCGPRGTGKTTVARLLAKSMNCLKRKEEGESEPCNTCDACREIMEGRSVDVIEIDAASHTGVDNVRENIIQNSKFFPTLRKYKVFIIDEVHMLSLSAFNALLKTLEEPPAHMMFILATTEIHKVPQTILSRCERFDFRKISAQEIVKRIEYIAENEGRKLDKEVAEMIARRSEGCVRDAEGLLQQLLSLDEKIITLEQARLIMPYNDFQLVIDFLKFLKDKRISEAIAYINRIFNEGVDISRFIDETIEGLRKVLLLNVSGTLGSYALEVRKNQEEELIQLSKEFSTTDITDSIEALIACKENLDKSPIPQLPLELAVMKICGFQKEFNPSHKQEEQKPEQKKTEENVLQKKTNIPLKTIIKENKKEAPKSITNSLTLENIKEKWESILSKVKEYNHTLFSFLRVIEPMSVKENIVRIAVSYSFHKERIDEMKNKTALENIFQEILGTPIKVECVLIERKEKEQSKSDTEIEALAQEFGGTVSE